MRLARRMEIRTTRREQAVALCDLGEARVLVDRMAASHHFDAGAAPLLELVQQRIQRDVVKIVATGMRNHGDAPGTANPAYGILQACPSMRNIARVDFGQVIAEYVADLRLDTEFHDV